VSVFEYKRNTDHQYNRLFSEDIDLIRIYVYTFHPPFIFSLSGSFYGFLKMLRSYVLDLIQDRYNKIINVMYSESGNGSGFYIDIDFWRDSKPDWRDSNQDWREFNRDAYYIAGVHIHDNGNILYKYGYISRDELRDIIRRFGSMAYGVALALIESMSNDPRCMLYICGDYLDWLEKHLSRITYFPVPDVEVYESVKKLVNGGGVPFESVIDIDENIYRELKEKHKALEYIDILIPMDSYIHRILEQYKYTVNHGIISYIDINTLINGITIIFEAPLSNIIETSFWIDPDKPKIYMNINTEFVHNINHIADVIRNWYDYTSKTIMNAIEKIENLDNVDRDTVNVLKNYLETWLKVISIYRNDIEKNKKF